MTAKQPPVRRLVLEHAAGAQLPAYGQCPGCPEGELAEGGVCARHAEPVDPDGSLHYAGEDGGGAGTGQSRGDSPLYDGLPAYDLEKGTVLY